MLVQHLVSSVSELDAEYMSYSLLNYFIKLVQHLLCWLARVDLSD